MQLVSSVQTKMSYNQCYALEGKLLFMQLRFPEANLCHNWPDRHCSKSDHLEFTVGNILALWTIGCISLVQRLISSSLALLLDS